MSADREAFLLLLIERLIAGRNMASVTTHKPQTVSTAYFHTAMEAFQQLVDTGRWEHTTVGAGKLPAITFKGSPEEWRILTR